MLWTDVRRGGLTLKCWPEWWCALSFKCWLALDLPSLRLLVQITGEGSLNRDDRTDSSPTPRLASWLKAVWQDLFCLFFTTLSPLSLSNTLKHFIYTHRWVECQCLAPGRAKQRRPPQICFKKECVSWYPTVQSCDWYDTQNEISLQLYLFPISLIFLIWKICFTYEIFVAFTQFTQKLIYCKNVLLFNKRRKTYIKTKRTVIFNFLFAFVCIEYYWKAIPKPLISG